MFSLIRKDFLCLIRDLNGLIATIVFSFLLSVLSSFAYRGVAQSREDLFFISSGVLWLNFIFVGVVFLNNLFRIEKENRALVSVITSGISLSFVYFSKVFVSFVFLFFISLITFTCLEILFSNGIVEHFASYFVISSAVTLGFVSVGALLACISSAVKMREVVLPLILFPVSVPLFLSAISLTRIIYLGDGEIFSSIWFVFIICFDLISLTLGWLLFEYAISE